MFSLRCGRNLYIVSGELRDAVRFWAAATVNPYRRLAARHCISDY